MRESPESYLSRKELSEAGVSPRDLASGEELEDYNFDEPHETGHRSTQKFPLFENYGSPNGPYRAILKGVDPENLQIDPGIEAHLESYLHDVRQHQDALSREFWGKDEERFDSVSQFAQAIKKLPQAINSTDEANEYLAALDMHLSLDKTLYQSWADRANERPSAHVFSVASRLFFKKIFAGLRDSPEDVLTSVYDGVGRSLQHQLRQDGQAFIYSTDEGSLGDLPGSFHLTEDLIKYSAALGEKAVPIIAQVAKLYAAQEITDLGKAESCGLIRAAGYELSPDDLDFQARKGLKNRPPRPEDFAPPELSEIISMDEKMGPHSWETGNWDFIANGDARRVIMLDAWEALGQIGTRDAAQAAIEILEYARNARVVGTAAKTLENIDSGFSAMELVGRLSDPAVTGIRKRILGSTLFRLELGRVGISTEGLDYLGRRFDLGEDNNPDYFAHRITPDGKVGIFDEQRRLEGFVQLEAADFARPESEATQKQVVDITLEMLFATRANETPEQIRQKEEVLTGLKENYFSTYLGMFDRQSDVRFNNLELPEQGWVLQYLNGANEQQQETFFTFLSRYGEDGFRAFRSMEFGADLAQKVLAIGEKDQETARRVFVKYGEITHTASRASSLMESALEGREVTRERVNEVTLNLLRHGRDLIARFAENPPSPEEADRELNGAKTEVLLFAETFKALKRSGEAISLEDFRSAKIEQIGASEISPEDKAQMASILEQNWGATGDPTRSRIYETALRPGFERRTSDPRASFYLVKYGPDVIAYLSTEPLPDGSVYAASLNVRPGVRGSRIGEAALEEVIGRIAEKTTVRASALATDRVFAYYLEKGGFVGVGINEDLTSKTGAPYLSIERDGRKALFSPEQVSEPVTVDLSTEGLNLLRERLKDNYLTSFRRSEADPNLFEAKFAPKSPGKGNMPARVA